MSLFANHFIFSSTITSPSPPRSHPSAAATVLDPFEKVPGDFKDPLTAEDARALEEGQAHMEVDSLMPFLKEFIVINLTGDHIQIKPDANLKEYFGYFEKLPDVYQDVMDWSDIPWFAEHFPDKLTLNKVRLEEIGRGGTPCVVCCRCGMGGGGKMMHRISIDNSQYIRDY